MEGQEKSTIKQILLIIMSLVFLTITYYVFSNLVFDMGNSAIKLNFLERENTEASIARIRNASKKIIPIDVEIFEDEKFLELSEMSEKTVELEKHKLGKKNPFEISSSTEDELIDNQDIEILDIDNAEDNATSSENEIDNNEKDESPYAEASEDKDDEILDNDDIESFDDNENATGSFTDVQDDRVVEDDKESKDIEIFDIDDNNNGEIDEVGNPADENLEAEDSNIEAELNNDIEKYNE